MPNWFTPFMLVLDALAVFRLTHLITDDRIPVGPLRDWVQRRRPDSLLAEWFTCPWCCSPYVAAAVLVTHGVFPGWWPYVAAVLAFSAVAGLLSSWA